MRLSRSSPPGPTSGYTERLTLPWWLWSGGLAVGVLLATEIWMGADGLRAWLPYVVLLPATVAGLWWLGRIRIAVADGELRVDDARLPVRFVADVVPLDADGRREVLGVGADPLAFVVQRPWVGGAVQVLLDDPADPTPFWVVSTRHPVRLAEALLAARDASPPGGVTRAAPVAGDATSAAPLADGATPAAPLADGATPAAPLAGGAGRDAPVAGGAGRDAAGDGSVDRETGTGSGPGRR